MPELLTLADSQATALFEPYRVPLTAAYIAVLSVVAVYGLHRYFLVWTWRRHQRDVHRPEQRFAEHPRVTVQLPVFNEGQVVQRAIDAVCKLEWPKDKLQVQILDDSTDDSLEIARVRVEYWRARGVDVVHIHRTDRTGFKAGALANGLKSATGEFVALFDADFVPPTNFLKRTIHHFTDAKLAVVQTRWDHLNREDSALTRAQAILLDGHFVIEHTARNRSGRWFNFSGTGGVWRVAAIEDAGGWEHDTLTEDMDLSYRAQLNGWDFRYLPHIACPAELPPEVNAFKSQQHRWTKGTVQTMLKLLPRILRAKAPFKCKLEACFHLTHPLVYLLINVFVLLFFPTIAANADQQSTMFGVLFGFTMFGLGALSAGVYYTTSQRILGKPLGATLFQMPVLLAVGVGIALNNAIACLEALVGHRSDFIRTPKYNRTEAAARQSVATAAPVGPGGLARLIPVPSLKRWVVLVEIALGVYLLWCIVQAWGDVRTALSLPFLFIFAAGYLYVGLSSAWLSVRCWMESREIAATPEAA
ncbi:MAG: cellulose synthase family protein [Planctomycetota bacterium]